MNILKKIFCRHKNNEIVCWHWTHGQAVLEEPETENYRMSDICKDRETLRPKYEQFIQTERGKEWKHFWQSQTGSERSGDFGDYLYDFYPEMLQ